MVVSLGTSQTAEIPWRVTVLGGAGDENRTRVVSLEACSAMTASLQVIPVGAGPCQDLGDLRFGLSSVAARTSRWASGSRLGRSPTA